MLNKTKISVIGAGYVGLSLAVLLAQKNIVSIVDIDQQKVDLINDKQSPFRDKEIEIFLREKKLSIEASTDYSKCIDSSYVIIATPTDYDEKSGFFDTSIVVESIEKILEINNDCCIIIKSTVPIGFTESMRKKYHTNRIIFSPEFLQEGTALLDNLYPSRIIIGDKSKDAKRFGSILLENTLNNNELKVMYLGSNESESIKLFANTYLAMRVAFFNELDSYSAENNLNVREIIKGVSSDKRIGNFYNNPSFGYGGYCLPKDSKQLRMNFENIPQKLISAIIESNRTRAEYISKLIVKENPKTIGIFRLAMKTNSDNFKNSSVLNVIKYLNNEDVEIIIYEPLIKNEFFDGFDVYQDLDDFILKSDIIITNRFSEDLKKFAKKVFTRDLFGEN